MGILTIAAADRLVILGSGITALAVARCAHRLGMRPLVFDTQAEIATASRHVQTEIHPDPLHERTLERLLQLGRERRSQLVATSDAWLRVLIRHRSPLESAYTRVLHPPNETLAVCLDKGLFSTWCNFHGLSAPRHYRIDHPSGPEAYNLNFPLLLRPAETLHADAQFAGCKAVEIRSHAELRSRLGELARANRLPVLSESLLGRPLVQYSVGFARWDNTTISVIARKLRPLPGACAHGTLVETAENSRIDVLAKRVVRLLDYNGIGEIEILHDADSGEDFLIEVNPRPWLQFALGAAAGRDLLGLVTQGKAVVASRRPEGGRCVWLDFRADLRVCVRSPEGLLRTGRIGVTQYLRSIAAARVFARWSVADQAPFWRDLLDMLRL